MPEADPGQRLPQLPQQYEAQNEPQEIIGAESSIQSEFGSKRSGKRKRRDEDAAILSEEQRDAFHSWLRLRKGPPPLEKLVLYAQSAEIPIALLQKYLAKISNGMAIYNTGEPVVQGPIAPRNITTLVGSTQGRPATAAAASHVPSSSTSNGQHGVAQHTTLDEEMRSCWDSCVKKKIDSQKCREVPESEPYTGEYIWQCTWGCNRRFKRKDEWERHEHNRQPQDLWVCILCRESQERSQHPHITFRLDKMKEHLVKVHFKSKKEADDIYGPASCYEYPTTIEPLCGFGGYAFRNDHDRSHHLTEHFMGRYGHFNIKDYDRNWDPAIQGVCSTDESTQSEALLVPAEFRGTRSSQSGFSTGKSASRTRNSSASPSSFRPQTSSHMNNLPTSVPLASFTYFTHRIALLGTLVFGLNGLELGLHFEETLGQGAFARVEKVRHGPTGLHFAMKSHYRSNQPEAAFRHFKHELQIMQRLNHPNCVHLVAAFPHARMPSLIMAPVADFDLERYLLRPDQYPDVQIHEVIRGFIALASGLLYLHSQSVLHNDIKPANILVKTTDLIYADFGTSSTTSDVPHTSHSPTLTPIYAAPEVLHFSKRSAGSDVFSLGCVFLELATVVLSLPVSGLRARVASSIGKCGRKYCSCERRPVSRQYLRPKVSALRGTAAILADRLLGLCLNMLNPLTTLRPTSLDVLSDLSRLLHIMPPSISTPRGFWSLEAHNAGRKSAAKGLYSSNVGFRRPTMSPFSDLLLHWTVRFHPRRQPTPVRPALLGPKPHAKRETQVQPFAHENNNASGLLELGPPTSPSEPFSVRLVDRNVASTLGANDIAVFDDKTGLSYVTEGATRVKNLGKWQNLAILAPVLRAAATIAFDLPVRFLWIIRQSPEPLNVMSIFQHAAAIITASILVPYVDGYSESLIKAFRRMRLDRKKRLYLRQSDLEAGGLPDKEDAEGEDCDYLGTDRRRLSLVSLCLTVTSTLV